MDYEEYYYDDEEYYDDLYYDDYDPEIRTIVDISQGPGATTKSLKCIHREKKQTLICYESKAKNVKQIMTYSHRVSIER